MRSSAPRNLLGEILVSAGACTPGQIDEALDDQVVYDGRLGTNLLERGVVTEEQLARALSVQQGLPASWGEIAVDRTALAVVAAAGAARWQAVPLRLDRRALDVLVSEARDPIRLDDMSFAFGKEVRPVLVPEARLWELLRRYYGVPSPRRRSRGMPRPAADAGLASHQELLLELQASAGGPFRAGVPHRAAPAAAPARAPAPPPIPPARTPAAPQVPQAGAPAPPPIPPARTPAAPPVPPARAAVTPARAAQTAACGAAPYRVGFEGALVTDESILAEMQERAARWFRPGLPAAGVASSPARAPAVARASPPLSPRTAP